MLRRALIAGLASASLLGLSASPADAAPAVKISKVYYDSPGSDTGSNSSLNGEYFVVKNTTGTARYITGWTVKDVTGYTYKFGTFKLGAYASVKVHTGSGSNTSTDRYWGRGWYVWNNTSDTAYLRNASGTLVHQCAYNSSAYDYKNC